MSFCSECGAALPPDARFCTGCGTPVQHRTTDAGQPTDDAAPPTNASSGSTGWTAPRTSVHLAAVQPTWTVTDPDGFSGAQVRTESDGVATFSYEEDTAYADDEEEWESATSEETFSMWGEVTIEGDSLTVTWD